jgi:hypothetical protein
VARDQLDGNISAKTVHATAEDAAELNNPSPARWVVRVEAGQSEGEIVDKE